MVEQVTVGEAIGRGTGHLSAAEMSQDQAQEFAETIATRYMRPVNPDAPACCIDGRCAKCTMAGEGTMVELGPHVAGGTLLTAFGGAELVPDYYGDQSAPTVLGRLKEMKTRLVGMGIAFAAHVTAGAVDKGFLADDGTSPKTGCGLNDEFVTVMEKAANGSEDKAFIDATTQALLGEAEPNENAMQFRTIDQVTGRISDYNSRDALEVVAGADGEDKDKVEILLGDHGEQLVVFNYVENTTIDRDALVRDTGKQVFIVDMWYIKKLANQMAEGRPDAVEMAEKLEHAMVAFQVATYLTLCDGTHRTALFGQPQPVATEAVSA